MNILLSIFSIKSLRCVYFTGLFCFLANAAFATETRIALSPYNPAEFQLLNQEISAGLFWKKASVARQMLDRKIPVSVVHKDLWSFKGAGIVRVPMPYMQEKLVEFSRLGEISERFQDLEFDAKKSQLKFKLLFLSKSYPMNFILSEEKGAGFYRLYFKSSEDSAIAGILGRIEALDAGQHLEISHVSRSPKMPGWGPDWFLSLIAEGIMHHVAEHLRKSLESSYILSQQK